MTITVRSQSFMTGLVVLLLASPMYADAQVRGDRSQDREQMEQRFRRQMVRTMQQRLELDDVQVESLLEVLRSHQGDRRRLGQADMAVRRRVEALMLEGATDEAEAEQLMARMRRLRTEEARLFAQEQEELLEFLTAEQVLKLQLIRDDMGRRIQRLRGRDGPEPRSPRGNGYI